MDPHHQSKSNSPPWAAPFNLFLHDPKHGGSGQADGQAITVVLYLGPSGYALYAVDPKHGDPDQADAGHNSCTIPGSLQLWVCSPARAWRPGQGRRAGPTAIPYLDPNSYALFAVQLMHGGPSQADWQGLQLYCTSVPGSSQLCSPIQAWRPWPDRRAGPTGWVGRAGRPPAGCPARTDQRWRTGRTGPPGPGGSAAALPVHWTKCAFSRFIFVT